MDQRPLPPAQYLSLEDAAVYCGCSSRTLRRRIADGSLRGYRLGPRLLRVSLAELDRMLQPVPAGDLSSDGVA